MPQPKHYYEPDAIDCSAMATALSEDFSVICELKTQYERDLVLVVARCYEIGGEEPGLVQVQAMVQAPCKARKSLYTLQYSAMLDCWHQLDRGNLAAASRPIERGWSGRPTVPRRARK